MKQLKSAAALFVAFACGIGASRALLPTPAQAQATPVVATSIDLNAMLLTDFPPPNAALPDLRTKALAIVDQTQFAYSVGLAPKHTHANTTEVQLFLGGSGTEWLGDKQISISPGTFVVIPPNTVHGGLVGGPFRIYTVKTPPQLPTDYHPTT